MNKITQVKTDLPSDEKLVHDQALESALFMSIEGVMSQPDARVRARMTEMLTAFTRVTSCLTAKVYFGIAMLSI